MFKVKGSKMNKMKIRIGIAVVAMGVSANAATQKFTEEELAYMPATAQIELFKAGVITPTDVLEAQIARVQKYNGACNENRRDLKDELDTFNAGKVNALTFACFEEARREATAATERYRNGTARKLEGVTVGMKDDFEVRGWTHDSASFVVDAIGRNAKAEADDDVVAKLRAEGAIFPFQTTVPEFCISCMTWSRMYGVTRNPWNLFYGVGGSSGGSGASLAAGFCTLATGTDMGGSTRIPSAMNGVYGFKPPFGRVATIGNAYCSSGPMARTFDDMALMQNVMHGLSKKVQFSLRQKLDYTCAYAPIKGEKVAVAYMRGWLEAGLDKDVAAAMDRTVAALKRAGAEIVPVDFGWKQSDIGPVYLKGLLATDLYEMYQAGIAHHDLLCTYAISAFDAVKGLTPEASVNADYLITDLHVRVQSEVFDKGCIALVMPTLSTAHVPADIDATPAKKADVNGKPYGGLDFCLTFVWNLMNAYPVVDVPAGLSSRNVPIGVQVIANTYDDLEAFRVASALSKALPQNYRDGRFPDFRNKK